LKAEHDKAIEEAKKKAAELEAAKKTLEEEAKKNAPDPDSSKAPIIFKDALGRKFNFPYSVCKTWKVRRYVLWSENLSTDSILRVCMRSFDKRLFMYQTWDRESWRVNTISRDRRVISYCRKSGTLRLNPNGR